MVSFLVTLLCLCRQQDAKPNYYNLFKLCYWDHCLFGNWNVVCTFKHSCQLLNVYCIQLSTQWVLKCDDVILTVTRREAFPQTDKGKVVGQMNTNRVTINWIPFWRMFVWYDDSEYRSDLCFVTKLSQSGKVANRTVYCCTSSHSIGWLIHWNGTQFMVIKFILSCCTTFEGVCKFKFPFKKVKLLW
jgi:hypothetical protein